MATGPMERESIYLDERMEVISNKKNAFYYCKMENKTAEGYFFKAYFITGEVKMEGTYLDDQMEMAHGIFTFYYREGGVESTGEFRHGKKFGLWQRFNPDGSEKAEKIYMIDPVLNAILDQ